MKKFIKVCYGISMAFLAIGVIFFSIIIFLIVNQ